MVSMAFFIYCHLILHEFDLSNHFFQVLYKRVIAKGCNLKANLPFYLSSWVDKISPHCMFCQGQKLNWSLVHLKTGSWYLDCRKGFCPKEEHDLKNLLILLRSLRLDPRYPKTSLCKRGMRMI
jgi:hypothetical protein